MCVSPVAEVAFSNIICLSFYFLFQYHQNTGPFLALRFAQRFGISNPPPRYVDAVATAFRQGYYIDESTGIEFGSKKYGDMSAFIAALLLDREARSVVLDVDPSHGSALEPFLKILRVMRSLEFVPSPEDMFVLFGVNLQEAVGQQPYEMPSVFSFFLPEHKPAGKFNYIISFAPVVFILRLPLTCSLATRIHRRCRLGLSRVPGSDRTEKR